MKCPFCGSETPERKCKRCHAEIPEETKEVRRPKRNERKDKEGE